MKKQRRSIVTGGAPGGIGQAISRTLAQGGDHVTLVEKDPIAGERAVHQLNDEGLDVELRIADLSDSDQVEELMATVPTLDVLVNNAGHAGRPSQDNLADSTPEQFNALFRNNLLSAFLMTKAAVRLFFGPQGFGRVLFLSTNNGMVGALGQLGYGTAKQALNAMSKILAAEHSGTEITFNCISPGIIETDGPNWRERRDKDPLWRTIEGYQNPTGRLGSPSDVAALVAFLASDEASFINGADIPIDGGLRATGIMFPGFQATNARQSYVDTFRSIVEAIEFAVPVHTCNIAGRHC